MSFGLKCISAQYLGNSPRNNTAIHAVNFPARGAVKRYKIHSNRLARITFSKWKPSIGSSQEKWTENRFINAAESKSANGGNPNGEFRSSDANKFSLPFTESTGNWVE